MKALWNCIFICKEIWSKAMCCKAWHWKKQLFNDKNTYLLYRRKVLEPETPLQMDANVDPVCWHVCHISMWLGLSHGLSLLAVANSSAKNTCSGGNSLLEMHKHSNASFSGPGNWFHLPVNTVEDGECCLESWWLCLEGSSVKHCLPPTDNWTFFQISATKLRESLTVSLITFQLTFMAYAQSQLHQTAALSGAAPQLAEGS